MGSRFKRVADCSHITTLSVISEGLERVICEDCGDVSFRYETWVSGETTRSAFARRSEDRFLKKLIELADSETNGNQAVSPRR